MQYFSIRVIIRVTILNTNRVFTESNAKFWLVGYQESSWCSRSLFRAPTAYELSSKADTEPPCPSNQFFIDIILTVSSLYLQVSSCLLGSSYFSALHSFPYPLFGRRTLTRLPITHSLYTRSRKMKFTSSLSFLFGGLTASAAVIEKRTDSSPFHLYAYGTGIGGFPVYYSDGTPRLYFD